MPGFAANPEMLVDIVERMARFEQQLESALDDADQRVNRLHATWTGAAATEHLAAHRRWAQGAREMREALAVMRQIATVAEQNYTDAATTNAQMWAEALG